MISYFLPLILLSLLAFIENLNRFSYFIKNKYLYFCIFLFFIFFVSLRHSIGCDWDVYEINFNNIASKNLSYILKNQDQFFDLGYSILAKLVSLKFDYSMLIFIYGILFTAPLFYFCANIKRTYLSLMICYPYFILVVGMGPIRQASAIAFLMMALVFIEKRKNYLLYLSSLLSMLLHHSAIIINAIFVAKFDLFLKLKRKKTFSFVFYLLFISIIIFNYQLIINKLILYVSLRGSDAINPAKGAIFVWFINFLPSIIFLLNYSKFNFNISIKKYLRTFSFLVIAIFPLLFINSVIAYRFILYAFPSSIYISSYIQEIEFFNIKQNTIFYSLIFLCFLSLFVWLKYAYHAYCWLPYKNILFL